MTNEHPTEEYELAPEGNRRLGWIAAALTGVLAVAAGGWGWTAERRAGTAERALTAAVVDRDAAMDAGKQWQDLLNQAETVAQGTDARVGELEQRVQSLDELLQTANMEVSRLESELAVQVTPEVASEQPTSPATIVTSDVTAAEGGPGMVEAPVAAVEPAAAPVATEPGPAPEPRSLAIVFDVNSSYLPATLDGRLRDLAARLEPGRGYEVELVGSVGNGDVEGQSPEEALRYNRWMAERRVGRVADFLERNAEVEILDIRRDFALNDPSRRVLVEVKPFSE